MYDPPISCYVITLVVRTERKIHFQEKKSSFLQESLFSSRLCAKDCIFKLINFVSTFSSLPLHLSKIFFSFFTLFFLKTEIIEPTCVRLPLANNSSMMRCNFSLESCCWLCGTLHQNWIRSDNVCLDQNKK